MKLKIGNKVRFLNEKGEGIVTAIINKTTVGVTIEDGFEIPFPIAQLVLIETSKSQSPTSNIQYPTTKNPISNIQHPKPDNNQQLTTTNKQQGIYIAFSPVNPDNIAYSAFNVWLVNNTDYQLFFTYSVLQHGNYITAEAGAAKAKETLLIETIDRKQLHDYSTFKIDVLFFNHTPHDAYPPISELIKLKPIKLYKENAFAENAFIATKAMIMTLHITEEAEERDYEPPQDLVKLLFQKQKTTLEQKTRNSKPHVNNNPAYEIELDLHIEELLDDFKGMSNAQIIQVQLQHLQKTLDTAINEHYRKLIVIHGVGNGRLKQEVCAILDTYNNLTYYDASYAKYGFGATEVKFKH